MKITVLCAGKLKERYFADAVFEYKKRLGRYADVEIIEVSDGPDPEAEAERFLKRMPQDAYVITLEIAGKSFSSEDFAKYLSDLALNGKSHTVFIIGGSDGLSERICRISDLSLSFSDLTFPHMLMRVILLEQIYRAMKIINHEPYHK